MASSPSRIVVDISGHGFGHLGQISPVLTALASRRPDIEIAVRTAIPDAAVRQKLSFACDILPAPPECIPIMRGPNTVDAPASKDELVRFHDRFAQFVNADARKLSELGPSLLIADISYASLAAATVVGIPAFAFSSLNWHDIFSAYIEPSPEFDVIAADIRAAYASAKRFIQCVPHLPMEWLPNRLPVGPVAAYGSDRRSEIVGRCGWSGDTTLILVSYGGIAGGFQADRLPRIPGVRWIFGDLSMGTRGDGANYAALKLPFVDVVRSVDLVITKPGYGLFTECACNGTRLLFVERPDWPETVHMAKWIDGVGVAASVTADRLAAGDIAGDIETLLSRPASPAVPATGVAETVDAILAQLDGVPFGR